MLCHSVACGTANPTRRATPLTGRSFQSRSHDAVIKVYDATGNVIATHKHAGASAEPWHFAIGKTESGFQEERSY